MCVVFGVGTHPLRGWGYKRCGHKGLSVRCRGWVRFIHHDGALLNFAYYIRLRIQNKLFNILGKDVFVNEEEAGSVIMSAREHWFSDDNLDK